MVILCLSLMPAGDILFNFPLHYLILGLDVLALLAIRHTGDLEYGMDLLPFLAVVVITLVFQSLLAGGYYNAGMAASSAIVLFAMIICIILVMQKGFAEMIWKIFNFFVLLSACCIVLQMVCLWVGIRLDKLGLISKIFFNVHDFVAAFRPSGMFLEPAIFAQPALMSLFYYMFIDKRAKKVALLTLALLLSTSALALMGLIILYVIWIFRMDVMTGVSRRWKWAFLGLSLVLGVALLTLTLNMGVFIVERLMGGSSIGVRVLRSIDLFQLMTPTEKITGIGLQNQAYYLNFNNIILANDTYETTIRGSREYAGTLGYVLCTTGFFGLVFFVQPFYRLFKRYGLQVKVACTMLIYSLLFCAMLATPSMMINFLLVYSTVDMERSGAFAREADDD